jgi:putative peptidoglycan lipid II flippase
VNASQQKKQVIFSSIKMGVATFLSRILGLIREQSIAAMFGASGITDAFWVAYRIPNMLRDLFAEGAFSAAFVPVFTELRQKSDSEARSLLWSLFILLSSVTMLISAIVMFFAPEIVGLISPSFLDSPTKLELTVNLTRIMAPFLVIISIAALFMGALNSMKVFFIPALAPALFNISMISSILFLPSVLHYYEIKSIYALAIGVMVGGVLQALFQFPLLIKHSYGPTRKAIKLISKDTKKVMNRVGIGTVGIAATQINILVNTILATGTVVGAVSWLTYAFRLFQFPIGILGVSIAGSNLVFFSDAWKAGKKENAISFLNSSVFLSFLILMPAAIFSFVMSDELVSIVFQRGEFVVKDVANTSLALQYYMLGLPCYGIYKIFVPVFYAIDKPKIPVFISVFSICINIIFCILLTPRYGFKVLALGTSVSMLVNSFLQGVFLNKSLNISGKYFFNIKMIKVFIASAIIFVITRKLKLLLFTAEIVFLKKILFIVTIFLLVVLSYAIILIILGEHQILFKFIQKIKNKFLN